MIKDGKEYSLIILDGDPDWSRECDSPRCINKFCFSCLEELTPRDFSKTSMAELSYEQRKPTRKVYCEQCMHKMFTEDEIKVLEDEYRERYRRRLEEHHRECVEKGYGLYM